MPETTKPPASADLVIVGGGIIGLSVAYEAVAAGHSVVVIERHRCGGGATPVAAGMLAPVSEAEPTLPGMVELGLESCRLYPDFIDRIEADSGLSCDYRSEGTISIAVDRDQMEELEHRAVAHKDLGLEAKRLSTRAVLELEPALSAQIVGGLHTETDRQVDPRALSAALGVAAGARGAVLAEGTELVSVQRDTTGSVRGILWCGADEPSGSNARRGVVETRNVVLCAGAWTRELIPETADLPLYPVKGQVIRLRGDIPLSHVVASPDVYLVPRATGELVVGASMEEQGFDDRPTAGATMDLLGQAWRLLPAVYELEVTEINVGFRPTLPDHMPAIGPIDPPGAFVATGHYRNGILLAPATAKYLVEMLATGVTPKAIAGFSPARFTGAHNRTEPGIAEATK